MPDCLFSRHFKCNSSLAVLLRRLQGLILRDILQDIFGAHLYFRTWEKTHHQSGTRDGELFWSHFGKSTGIYRNSGRWQRTWGVFSSAWEEKSGNRCKCGMTPLALFGCGNQTTFGFDVKNLCLKWQLTISWTSVLWERSIKGVFWAKVCAEPHMFIIFHDAVSLLIIWERTKAGYVSISLFFQPSV